MMRGVRALHPSFRSLVSVAEFENKFFYLRKKNLKIIINEKQQLHQTAVISWQNYEISKL